VEIGMKVGAIIHQRKRRGISPSAVLTLQLAESKPFIEQEYSSGVSCAYLMKRAKNVQQVSDGKAPRDIISIKSALRLFVDQRRVRVAIFKSSFLQRETLWNFQ